MRVDESSFAQSILEVGIRVADPVRIGWPDLLDPSLTPSEQDARLAEFIDTLRPKKDGKPISPHLIPEMLRFVSDVFFLRTRRAMLWKSRGCGGTLMAAILIWLVMVYRGLSFTDMAGSKDQAKNLYDYVKSLWETTPGAERLLADDPKLSETLMTDGTRLMCCAASDKAARGQHRGGFVGDEACQADRRVGEIMDAAIQGVMSEDPNVVVLLSTRHWRDAFFGPRWDHAEKRGYSRYKWDIFDVMKPCTQGLDTATGDDPQALDYCRTQCPLTERSEDRNESGDVTSVRYRGCNGKARKSQGWMSYRRVLEIYTENAGGDRWWVEFCNELPKTEGPFFHPDDVEACVVEKVESQRGVERCVGIDWGAFAVAVMVERHETTLGVPVARVFRGMRNADIVDQLCQWRTEYGQFDVLCDAEDERAAMDVDAAGFNVGRLAFGKYRKSSGTGLGAQNLVRLFGHRKLRIGSDTEDLRTVIEHCLGMHRDDKGNLAKGDDHGFDALLCACQRWDFTEEFPEYIEAAIRAAGGLGEDDDSGGAGAIAM